MRPIRIVLGKLPRLLRDIVVDAIEGESDMSVVGEAHGPMELEALMADAKLDVLVVDDDFLTAAGGVERLLRNWQRVKVLVLSAGGKDASLHWLQPRMVTCPDLSSEGLVSSIRMFFAETGVS